MQGRLIVFEGTDGSGKATQTALLCRELETRGVPFRKLEFPRYGEESSALLRLYLNGAFGTDPADVNAYAAATFYSVDRFASYKQDWGSYYEQGGLLIVGARADKFGYGVHSQLQKGGQGTLRSALPIRSGAMLCVAGF